jgi:hypothetical protein
VQPLDGSDGGGASAKASARSADEPSVNDQSPKKKKKNLTEMPLAFWRGRYASRRDFGLAQADPYDRGRAVDKRRKQLEVQKQAAQKTLRDLSSGGKGGEKGPPKTGGGGEIENGEDDGIEFNGEGGEGNYDSDDASDGASDEKEEEKEDGQRHHDSDDDANENDDLFGEGDDSVGFAAKREGGGGGFGVGVSGGLQKWGKVQGGVGTVKKQSTRARDAAEFGTSASTSTSSLKEKKEKNRRRNKRGGRGGVGGGNDDEEGEGGEDDGEVGGGGDAAWLMALNGDISGEFNRLEALEAAEAKRKQVRTSEALEAVATFERVGRREAARGNLPNQPALLLRKSPKQGQEEEEAKQQATPSHSSAFPGGLGGGVGGRGPFFPPPATALTKQGLDLVLLNARDPGSTAKASKLLKFAARLRRKHEKERGRNAKELEELRRIVALLDTR